MNRGWNTVAQTQWGNGNDEWLQVNRQQPSKFDMIHACDDKGNRNYIELLAMKDGRVMSSEYMVYNVGMTPGLYASYKDDWDSQWCVFALPGGLTAKFLDKKMVYKKMGCKLLAGNKIRKTVLHDVK